MTMAYAGAAGGLTLFAAGQQGGAALLERALQGDAPAITQVLNEAERVVGSGLTIGQAALIIAFVPVFLRLLQMASPWNEAAAAWWRRKILHEQRQDERDSPPAPETR